MKMVLFLVVGFIFGAGVLYLLQMKDLDRLDQADKELKKARQAFADAEIEHEQRLKEAIATLQDEYQQKSDRRALNLKAEYEEKIRLLKAQLPQAAPSDIPTPEPQSFSKTPEIAIIEPPILATDIQFLADPPAIQTATITGKTIHEPPILAQTKPTSKTLFLNGFEPPILATNIQFAPDYPTLSLSTPTGKTIEPPILAQAS